MTIKKKGEKKKKKKEEEEEKNYYTLIFSSFSSILATVQVRALADGAPGPYEAVIEARTLSAAPGPPKVCMVFLYFSLPILTHSTTKS